MEEITILHTNDLHSHIENWPRIRRFLWAKQAENKSKGLTTLTFDIGDAMDRVHPLTEATDGQFNVDLLNQGNYDAATIGNNEGIGNSKLQLEYLYDHAKFPIILGNLFDPDTGKIPSFATPWTIIETAQHTKIGVLGLTAPFMLTYQPNGWSIKLIQETLPRLIAELKPQVDFIILLSHLGLKMDRYLATNYSDLAVIIGAHTHHLLPVGEQVQHSMLAAAGKFGQFIGQIKLKVNDNHELVSSIVRVQETAKLPVLADDEIEINKYQQLGEAILQERLVAELPYSLGAKTTSKHPAITACLNAISQFVDADFAMLNQGLFLGDLPAGVITQRDLHQQLPHPMHIIKVELKGSDVWRLAMEVEKNRQFLDHFPLRGMSFRGKLFGQVVMQSLTIDRHQRALINGQELNPNQIYTLATVDNFLFIPFFPTIEIMGTTTFEMPLFIRQVFGEFLSREYPLSKPNK